MAQSDQKHNDVPIFQGKHCLEDQEHAGSSRSCHARTSEAVTRVDTTGIMSVPETTPKTFSARSFAEMQTFQIS